MKKILILLAAICCCGCNTTDVKESVTYDEVSLKIYVSDATKSIYEAFFYDNDKDFKYLLSEDGREQIAKWYVNSIKRCVELHKRM